MLNTPIYIFLSEQAGTLPSFSTQVLVYFCGLWLQRHFIIFRGFAVSFCLPGLFGAAEAPTGNCQCGRRCFPRPGCLVFLSGEGESQAIEPKRLLWQWFVLACFPLSVDDGEYFSGLALIVVGIPLLMP